MTKRKMSFDDLPIGYDFIFKLVMANASLLSRTLGLIMGEAVGEVELLGTEFPLESYAYKSVRMDVVARSESGVTYDVESQLRLTPGFTGRVEYYGARLTTESLESGATYERLSPRVVLFICSFDPFGEGLPVYMFKNFERSHRDVALGEGLTYVFVSTQSYAKAGDPELGALLEYLNGNEGVESELVNDLKQEVKKVKANESNRKIYDLYLNPHEEKAHYEGREEGRVEGREEGRVEGREEGRVEERYSIARRMLEFDADLAQVSRFTGLSLAELKGLRTGL